MKKRGYFYFTCLYQALTQGVKHYSEDTEQRADFVREHGHLFAGTMLVSTFAYLESTLGEDWISRCGGKQTRELNCLKFIRDAFVHKNGHLRDLGSHTQKKEDELRAFIKDMQDGKITDDKGNVYPCYIDLDNEAVVKLNVYAMKTLYALGRTICH